MTIKAGIAGGMYDERPGGGSFVMGSQPCVGCGSRTCKGDCEQLLATAAARASDGDMLYSKTSSV